MWKFTELTYFLASLYYRQEEILSIIVRAGLQPQKIYTSYNAIVFWTNIVKYAEDRGLIKSLVEEVAKDGHEKNEYIAALIQDINSPFKSPYNVSGQIPNIEIVEGQIELLTSGKKSFLPISFLSDGIESAKSVGRIVTEEGLGTGFVINKTYLLTNNHVIASKDEAINATVQFNYQLNSKGELEVFNEFYFDPESTDGFYTSKENDWTIVKIRDYNLEFGEISLKKVVIDKNDFVNIIQHPAGEFKQLALYNNLVVNVTLDRVQYLTDTLPGSSGSPVFNSNWEIVALHHQGMSAKKAGKDYLFNQGININIVLDELTALGFTF